MKNNKPDLCISYLDQEYEIIRLYQYKDDTLTIRQITATLSRNKHEFEGMESKSEYLIWREKNGFFTAISNQNILKTWSIYSGQLIFEKRLEEKDCIENAIEYSSHFVETHK